MNIKAYEDNAIVLEGMNIPRLNTTKRFWRRKHCIEGFA